MSYIRVADKAEVVEGKAKKAVAGGKEILLANIGDSYYAILEKCPHMGGSLSEGTLEDGIITRPRHGAKFDVRTGKAVGSAKLGFLKLKVSDDRSFPVKVEGADILVDVD